MMSIVISRLSIIISIASLIAIIISMLSNSKTWFSTLRTTRNPGDANHVIKTLL
jgi:hypothetical protein